MAKTTRVVWLDRQQYVGVDSSNHSVVMSAQDKENGTGMNPSDLLLVSLGGCAAYDVVSILQKKRQRLTGLEIAVTGEQDEEPPWTFRRIHVQYRVRGRELREKAVRDAIRLSEEKYCSVAATLRATVEITHDWVIIEDE
jgi:putative redox protein